MLHQDPHSRKIHLEDSSATSTVFAMSLAVKEFAFFISIPLYFFHHYNVFYNLFVFPFSYLIFHLCAFQSDQESYNIINIPFTNIRQAFVQPAHNDVATIIHFHLYNEIMVGSKRTFDIQFYVEVTEQSRTLGFYFYSSFFLLFLFLSLTICSPLSLFINYIRFTHYAYI